MVNECGGLCASAYSGGYKNISRIHANAPKPLDKFNSILKLNTFRILLARHFKINTVIPDYKPQLIIGNGVMFFPSMCGCGFLLRPMYVMGQISSSYYKVIVYYGFIN